MPRYAYVNGSYLPHKDALIHIEDRGYQFADGVYEVIACIHGSFADERGHLDRLERSLSEIGMDMPIRRESLSFIMHELVRRNRLKNANVYIQITRGVSKRDFPFPSEDVKPSIILTARPFDFDDKAKLEKGIKVVCVPDIRWKRRDIKSIALLGQVLAKQQAVDKGAGEAWMIDDDGLITEGSSSNAWIITKDNKVITRKADGSILRGVTRTALEHILKEQNLSLEERAFSPEQAYEAIEAFTSSATALIAPVVEIDGHKIGDGKPGKLAIKLYEEYREYVRGHRDKQYGWKA